MNRLFIELYLDYYNEHVLIDVQQVVPLPEAADYQIQVREKRRQERQSRKSSNVDFTRFDLNIDGTLYPSQWKRNAIFLVVKHLINRGRTPEDISKILAPVRGSRIWWIINHETNDIEEFKHIASTDAEANGRKYDDRRWHTSNGDLFVHKGKTYAFSNQWGRSWSTAMEKLQEQCSDVNFEWIPTTEKENFSVDE